MSKEHPKLTYLKPLRISTQWLSSPKLIPLEPQFKPSFHQFNYCFPNLYSVLPSSPISSSSLLNHQNTILKPKPSEQVSGHFLWHLELRSKWVTPSYTIWPPAFFWSLYSFPPSLSILAASNSSQPFPLPWPTELFSHIFAIPAASSFFSSVLSSNVFPRKTFPSLLNLKYLPTTHLLILFS